MKRMFMLMIALLWGGALLLSLELYAVVAYFNASRSVQHSSNWDVRSVREAFHGSLWAEPWVEYLPNAELSYEEQGKSYRISINASSFRGTDLGDDNRSGSIRIACLGGSTTVEGDTDESTYPACLQKILLEKGVRTSVLNCGISGLKSASYARVINRLVSKKRPDLVVEYNGVNDICWNLIPAWRRQLSPWQRLLLKSRFVSTYLGDRFLPDQETMRAEIDRHVVSNLAAAAELFERNGSRFAVASFICPDPSRMSTEEYAKFDSNIRYWWQCEHVSYRAYSRIVDIYNERIKKAFAGSRTMYLPLAESDSYPADYFLDICHMHDIGIQEKSRRLSELLIQNLTKVKN